MRSWARPLATISLLAVAACSSGSGQLEVYNAWARTTPPGADSAAFYLELDNQTSQDVTVVAATSSACEEIEFHTTEFVDDIVEMGITDQLPIEAGDRLVLEPRSLHLMCLGLKAPLEESQEVMLHLDLADSEPLSLMVEVRSS